MLPARHGDCIWIEYGTTRKTYRILIDAGPTPTWSDSLKERVGAKAEFELLVLTHIDADHIAGAIPFLKDVNANEVAVTFKDVWFNGWPQIKDAVKPAKPKKKKRKGLLSAREGEIFSTLLHDGDHPWNEQFGGGPIQVTASGPLPVKKLAGGMKLTILSPTPGQLARLRRKWSKELARHGLRPGAHAQYRRFLARTPVTETDAAKLAATPFRTDGSIPNAASIAFLAEYDGKAVLFTGDGVPKVLNLTIERLLRDRELDRLRLDALKVAHHGSRGNTNLEMLELLDCDRYLISCNGDIHKLPDNEAIGRIIHAGGTEPELVFNYDCARTEAWGLDDVRKKNPPYAVSFPDTNGHAVLDLKRKPRR